MGDQGFWSGNRLGDQGDMVVRHIRIGPVTPVSTVFFCLTGLCLLNQLTLRPKVDYTI